MKPAPFKYHDPQSLSELLDLTATLEDAKILAGGQSLMPMMNMRFVTPDDVVDINNVSELDFIESKQGHLRIGSMTRQREIVSSKKVSLAAPIIGEALLNVGHLQTRNRGTLGGSLCHLDPAAELPAIASLYDATMFVANKDECKEIPISDWSLAYMIPNLAPEDILTSISIPVWSADHGYAFIEFARRHGDFAICAAGVLIELDDKKVILRTAITIAGANVKPIRLLELEKNLIGQVANKKTFLEAEEEAKKIDAISDVYYTASYRQRLSGTLVNRALKMAAKRAGGFFKNG
jgi:aerobic carbon-monoxide dehydrogenase medium subunit